MLHLHRTINPNHEALRRHHVRLGGNYRLAVPSGLIAKGAVKPAVVPNLNKPK